MKRNELVDKLKSLTIDKIGHIYRDGLREAIKPFYHTTISVVKKQFKTTKKFFNFGQELKWSTNFNRSTSEYEGTIFINPQGALKWFELGTQDRYIRKKGAKSKKVKDTSKSGYRGKINSKYVFSRYTTSKVKSVGEKALNIIDNNLQKELEK